MAGETKFGTGEPISTNLSTGEATGTYLVGTLGQGILIYRPASIPPEFFLEMIVSESKTLIFKKESNFETLIKL